MWGTFTRAACCFAAAACAITARAEDQVVVEDDNGCKMYIGKYSAESRWKYNTGVSWSGACSENGFIHGPGVLEISSGDSRSATQMVQSEGKDDPAHPSWVRYSYDVHYRKLRTRSNDAESVELTSAESVPSWAQFIFSGEFTRPPAPMAKKNDACAKTVELKPDAETSLSVDLEAYLKAKGGAVPAGVELEDKLAEYRARPESPDKAALIAGAEQLFLAVQKCSEGWSVFDAGSCKVRSRYKPKGQETHKWQGGCLEGYADGPGRWEQVAEGQTTIVEAVMWKGIAHGTGFKEDHDNGRLKIVGDWDYGVRKRGTVHYSNGVVYEGTLSGAPLVGTLKYTDGASYSGELVKMQPHGRGRFTYTNGDIATGTFKEGKLHGRSFVQGKNWGKLGYRNSYEDGKLVQREEIYEGGLKKDIFADIANALNIANNALQGLGPAVASGRLRPEQTMALVAAQTAATMATQERPAIPVAASTPAASSAQAGQAGGGVLGPQDLEAALAQMAESKRRADEKRRAEEEQAKREAERQRLALAQEERRQAAEQRKQAKQEKQKVASIRRTEMREVTERINIPGQSGCVSVRVSKSGNQYALRNTCPYPIKVASCGTPGCRPSVPMKIEPGAEDGGYVKSPGSDVKLGKACQLMSGEFQVNWDSHTDQCRTTVRMMKEVEVGVSGSR